MSRVPNQVSKIDVLFKLQSSEKSNPTHQALLKKELFLDGGNLLEAIKAACDIETKPEKLGERIVSVCGNQSSYYHYFIYDEKTGKYAVPVVVEGGLEKYLDLRNILLTDALKGKQLIITMVHVDKDFPNSYFEPIVGAYGSFGLKEISFSGYDCSFSSQPSDLTLLKLPFMEEALLGRRLKNLNFFDAHRCFIFRRLENSLQMVSSAFPQYPTLLQNQKQAKFRAWGNSLFEKYEPAIENYPQKSNNNSPQFFQWQFLPSFQPEGVENLGFKPPTQTPNGFALGEFPPLPKKTPAVDGYGAAYGIQGETKNGVLPIPSTMGSLLESNQKSSMKKTNSHPHPTLQQPGVSNLKRTLVQKTPSKPTLDSIETANMAPIKISSRPTAHKPTKIPTRDAKKSPKHLSPQTGSHKKYKPTAYISNPVPIPFSSLKSLKAVIFDLDGVVVNTMELHRKSFNVLLAPLGIHIPKNIWMKQYGGMHSDRIMASLFEKHGIKKDIAPWVKQRTALYLKYQQENSIPAIEGFKEFHQFLYENKVKVAVASSGHASHVKSALVKVGLPNIKVVAIEHVRKGRGKPHPDLFLLAAKRLKAKKGSAIVFEDAPAGIEAARRAKLPCIALSTSLPPRKLAGKAALVVKNFRSKQLMRLIALLLARRGKLRRPQARAARLSRLSLRRLS